RGGEYLSQEFKDYLSENRIVQNLTSPSTPQQNGVSERRNRTLLDMVRSMFNLTTLPLSFWDYALEFAVHILNMVPTKKVDKTPYEIWHGKAPNLSYLKVWGCEAYMKRDSADKLQQRSVKCILVGYPKETMGYYYFPPENQVIVARYGDFLKRDLIYQKFSGRDYDLDDDHMDTLPSENTSEIPVEPESLGPPSELILVRRRAVVTGGNRGIGFEICHQLALTGIEVVLTSRNESHGVEGVEKLNSSGLLNVIFHQLDITDSASIARLGKFIETRFTEIGIIMHEEFRTGGGFAQVDDALTNVIDETYELGKKCLDINYYGTKDVTETLIPLLQLSKSPRIVNVTSMGGDLRFLPNKKLKEELQDIETLTEERIDEIIKGFLSDFKNANLQENGWPSTVSAYKVSKIALNAHTRLMARKFKNIIVNCVHPG
nr:glucose/ribitol dehydrogenase [Tanacetum cinerariifolium]